MKFIIFLFLSSIICYCNGDDYVNLDLYKFEKIVFDFVNVQVPAYRKTTSGLFKTIVQYSKKQNVGHKYLFDMPNIINTIIPCYAVCKNGVDVEMWTIPQIIDEPGVGPNIRADGEEIAQLGGGLVGVSKADSGVINGLTNLNQQFATLLAAPVFLLNGTVISVNSTIFGNIIKSLSQVAYQNDALGDSMEGIGSLVNSNMVKQISTEANTALIAILECLTNGANAYHGIGKAMNKFVTSLLTTDGSPDKATNTVNLSLPALYKSMDMLLAQLILLLNKAKNGFENMPNDFSGPYAVTQIPMQTPAQAVANDIAFNL